MQKKITLALVFFALGLAGWYIYASWHSDTGWGSLLNAPKKYSPYSGKGYLRVEFEYPSGWKILEDEGKIDAYNQVFVKGPRNAADTFTSTVVVCALPARSAQSKGRFDTVQHLRENYTTHLYRDPKFLETSNTSIQGRPAESVAAAYTLPPAGARLPQGPSPKNVETPMRARAFFTRDGDVLYQFIYSADSREFARHEAEFEHLVRSVRFKKS